MATESSLSPTLDVDAQDKKLLLLHVLQLSPEAYALQAPIPLSPQQQDQYHELLARRRQGEPIAKIIGVKHFWKHAFYTTASTLDPRPETEGIIEAALIHVPDTHAPLHILDCGTGTGCIIISLLEEYPNATGVALDISSEAIRVAKQNAQQLNHPKRLQYANLDWTDADFSLYDLVVSNPPYIPTQDLASLMPDVKEYEPHCVLDGGSDGLYAYRQLFQKVSSALKRNGLFICEVGYHQSGDVVQLGLMHGLSHINTLSDVADIPRIIVFQQP